MQERTTRICPECGQPLRVLDESISIDGRPRWRCEGPECHELTPPESPGWFAGTLKTDDGSTEPDR